MPKLVDVPVTERRNIRLEFTPFEQDVLLTVIYRIGGRGAARDVFSSTASSLLELLEREGAVRRNDLLDEHANQRPGSIYFKND